jgi:hypothetical protein
MMRILVIIEKVHLDEARALLEKPPFSLSAKESADTFVRADQGDTRYWLSGQVSDVALAACQQLASALPWAECHEYDLDTQPGFPAEWLTQNHLQPYTPDMP